MPLESEEMASRVQRLQPFVPALESIISTFTTSGARFHRVTTLDSSSPWPSVSAAPSSSSSLAFLTGYSSHRANNDRSAQKAIVVLDSSFNPPSKAHAALALAALARCRQQQRPASLLLLLGTKNADKHAQTPATYAQRLAMLILFATDLRDAMLDHKQDGHSSSSSSSSSTEDGNSNTNSVKNIKDNSNSNDVPVDIGLASIPYMADKADAIASDRPSTYAEDAKQIHVMGYDTIVRVLAPRYYDEFEPPLSALQPLFGRGHEALVVLRPDEDHTLEQQKTEIQDLIGGKLQTAGFETEWRGLVDTIECQDAADISSTKVRKAAHDRSYEAVQNLCTPTVAAWIQHQTLYKE